MLFFDDRNIKNSMLFRYDRNSSKISILSTLFQHGRNSRLVFNYAILQCVGNSQVSMLVCYSYIEEKILREAW